ncbi:hypothetical protein C366_03528 [Cryptococcus neoformans Tu401-1]|nr:hypothetical protein C366_03528 [Cryptococcus neoformans var. grubii Tu401-1]
MALPSSSCTSLRRSAPGVTSTLLSRLPAHARTYASPAAASSTSSSYPPPPLPSSTSSTTPQAAQSYLSNLFSLPPSRQFSPALALQILTHKSYRFAHPVRHSPSLSQAQSSIGPESSAPHNARLAFLGRRALSTYLALFVHEAYGSSGALREQGSDFLRGKELEERLTALRHVNNLGRMVGGEWRVEDVLRWDRNQTSQASGNLSVKGQTVEAILGGVFTQFGSPAAHRAFHLHVLPKFVSQLRDPFLVEKVETVREQLENEFGRGILPRD